MKTKTEYIQLIMAHSNELKRMFGIRSLRLFGSVSRDEQREDSDVDVCVKFKKTTFRIYMTMLKELEKLFNTKVDLLTLHENMRELFRKNIERDAIYV